MATRMSRGFGRTLAAVSLMALMALTFSRISGGQVVERVSEGPSQLVGLTVRYAMPDGAFVERRFVGEQTAHWKMLTGPHSGDAGAEHVYVQMVAAGMYFVNRVDSLSGETISEVYNLATRTIAVYTTRPDPDHPVRRIESVGGGRLEIVSAPDGAAQPAARRT